MQRIAARGGEKRRVLTAIHRAVCNGLPRTSWSMEDVLVGHRIGGQIMQLPETGYVRLTQIVGKPATATSEGIPPLIPIARSTWWAGVKSGRFPQPVRGLGPRITAWRVEDIRELIERLNESRTSSA